MEKLTVSQQVLTYVLMLWSLFWKGLALWRSAKSSQRNWFIVLLVVNTVGILEILYLFRFCKNKLTLHEIKGWFRKTFTSRSK